MKRWLVAATLMVVLIAVSVGVANIAHSRGRATAQSYCVRSWVQPPVGRELQVCVPLV